MEEEQVYGSQNKLGADDRQLLGRIFHRMQAEGKLNPTLIVAEAQNWKSPLHKYFDWDNQEAAHRWRLFQARMLIRAVVLPPTDTTPQQRAFIAVPNRTLEPAPVTSPSSNGHPNGTGSNGKRPLYTYVSRERAEADEQSRTWLKRKAFRMLTSWVSEFSEWAKEDPIFEPVLAGIRETQRRFADAEERAKEAETAKT